MNNIHTSLIRAILVICMLLVLTWGCSEDNNKVSEDNIKVTKDNIKVTKDNNQVTNYDHTETSFNDDNLNFTSEKIKTNEGEPTSSEYSKQQIKPIYKRKESSESYKHYSKDTVKRENQHEFQQLSTRKSNVIISTSKNDEENKTKRKKSKSARKKNKLENKNKKTNTLTIITIGSGNTKGEADISAIHSAIEQSLGTYMSLNKKKLTDELISDEIATIESGNYLNYKILSSLQAPNNNWIVIIRSIVTMEELKEFVESKGAIVEFKGEVFVTNIRQQNLNEEAEAKAISIMMDLIREWMPKAFDYNIEVKKPKKNNFNDKWGMYITMNAIANKNMNFCNELFINTLSSLDMSFSEKREYNALKKEYSCINVGSGNRKKKTFCLRSIKSRLTLFKICDIFNSSVNNYTIIPNHQSKVKSKYSWDSRIHKINGTYRPPHSTTSISKEEYIIYLIKKGKKAGSFQWREDFSKKELKDHEGYEVKVNCR